MTNIEYQNTRVRLHNLIDAAFDNGELDEREYDLAQEYIENADVPVSEKPQETC